MNNRDYWRKRSEHRETVSSEHAKQAEQVLAYNYRKAASQMRKEINDFYKRYEGENGLTYAEAVREMNRAELREWRGSVEDYIKQIQNEENPQVRERLMREYDARYYNSRISRLDGLFGNANMILGDLYRRNEAEFRELLGGEYVDGFYKALYDIQTRLGYNGNFSTIDAQMVENALNYPWSGANFSDRLWKNKEALMSSMREVITQGLIRGDSMPEMTRALAELLDASLSNAGRLIRTETSHIHNTAEIAAYDAAGYEEYEFMASFGERTCEVCGGLDGQHFKIADIQYGVNFPPVHPNCRCTTVGWDEADEAAELESAEQNALTYDEWYAKYVEGREPVQIAEHQTAPALIAEHQTAPALIAPTVDGREVVLTGSGDFLAFRHVDGLTDEQVSDIINNRGADIAEYRPNWARFSLGETVKRLLPNANVKDITNSGKVYYSDDHSPFEIVYVAVFDYFRIQTRGSRQQLDYRDINGNLLPNNVTLDNGKQIGRTKQQRMIETHFDNTDYRGRA